MINVYEQVSRNKIRSTVIITLFSVFILVVAYLIVYSFDLSSSYLFIALIISVSSSLGSFFYGDKIVLALNQARPATRKEFFNFYTVTENLCLGASMPLPKIYIIDSPAMNAFATGRDPEHAVVCVTNSIVASLRL